MERMRLSVVEKAGRENGHTVVVDDGSPVLVCIDADREGFNELLFETLTGRD
ncbi:MAG: hypothetical protein V1748_10015 [Actinomycetota bacterium]